MCKTWPYIDEMLKTIPKDEQKVHSTLIEKIRQRYEEHGMEYASEDLHEPGIPINKCMSANTSNDIREELVDAAFNALVLCYKKGDDNLVQTLWCSIAGVFQMNEVINK